MKSRYSGSIGILRPRGTTQRDRKRPQVNASLENSTHSTTHGLKRRESLDEIMKYR